MAVYIYVLQVSCYIFENISSGLLSEKKCTVYVNLLTSLVLFAPSQLWCYDLHNLFRSSSIHPLVKSTLHMAPLPPLCVCVFVVSPWCQENTSLHCLLKWSVSPPEPAFLPDNFKKKDVVEILSHKKAYNACEYDKNKAAGGAHTHKYSAYAIW